MAKVGLIISSVRPNRFADKPTEWIREIIAKRHDIDLEILDLKDFPLPFFDETISPAYGQVENETAKRWQARIEAQDGFIVVAAEYTHGPTAALKNALDYAYSQWNRKPMGFVGYGGVGGARAIEQLRLNAIDLQMAPVRAAVHIPMQAYMAVVQGQQQLKDMDYLNASANEMLDQFQWWLSALKVARNKDAQAKAA